MEKDWKGYCCIVARPMSRPSIGIGLLPLIICSFFLFLFLGMDERYLKGGESVYILDIRY